MSQYLRILKYIKTDYNIYKTIQGRRSYFESGGGGGEGGGADYRLRVGGGGKRPENTFSQ